MYYQQYASKMHIISVTSTASAQSLRALVDAAFIAKTPDVAKPTKEVIAIALTPSATLLVIDAVTGDSLSIAANATRQFDVAGALDMFNIINAATVIVEIYYAR